MKVSVFELFWHMQVRWLSSKPGLDGPHPTLGSMPPHTQRHKSVERGSHRPKTPWLETEPGICINFSIDFDLGVLQDGKPFLCHTRVSHPALHQLHDPFEEHPDLHAR